MNRVMHTVEEVERLIRAGKPLMLAGDEALLARLPEGPWIGGTIPYFIGEEGGVATRELIHVTPLPEDLLETRIVVYDSASISSVYRDAPAGGFSAIIIPATSKTHLEFALRAPQYESFAHTPLIGWISGVHLTDLGKVAPKIFDGRTRRALEDGAVVLHARPPEGTFAELGTVNIFTQGTGDTLVFLEDGFAAKRVKVNGVERNFVEYAREKALDFRLPLVADYFGTMVNVSFQAADEAAGQVTFYAPVFAGMEYRQAAPVKDYVEEFTSALPLQAAPSIKFSCNCILNYLYSELEGKRTAGITGPITFGEIAYQLLNQTMTYLTLTRYG